MALPLLLELVLPDQTLVPRRVVVVREELRQQQVHVGSALRRAWLPSSCVPRLLRIAGRIGHLGEILDVYAATALLRVVLDARALLVDQIVDAVVPRRAVRDVLTSLSLKAVVSHAEHLASEGVSHDGLA